uniref:Ammonium transporter AmtB-like domain-containing protein n=1 Tax=Quercus lobata TaxID=97700 RepID=A0A7N2M1Z5_QUELO
MNYSSYNDYNLPEALFPDEASPPWNNKGDNAWQLTATTLVGLQTDPGLVILYGTVVKKKWAVNSAFMALYAFAAVLICWVLWAHHMSFGAKLFSIMGRPMVLLAGSLLGRMNFYAWMFFVPLWLTFCYTIGAFTIWGHGFLQPYIIDYAGGFVVHLSSGVAGFTAAYWVWPRHSHDRQNFPPNNIIHMLSGAGFLWLGWTGFNGGSPFAANEIAALAIVNTHLCAATSLLVWVSVDMIIYKKSSVIGAVQGMITGLICITPGAGLVSPWAAVFMGTLSGLLPWHTMMVLHRKSAFFQSVDDTLGVSHPCSGCLESRKLIDGLRQIGYQLAGVVFITVWNAVMTSIICIFISRIVNLRMDEDALEIGDDAAHGEEAFALWGDGEKMYTSLCLHISPRLPSLCRGQV